MRQGCSPVLSLSPFDVTQSDSEALEGSKDEPVGSWSDKLTTSGRRAIPMRDFVAAIVAILLLLVALSLATALQAYRRRRQRSRDSEVALGRAIIAEIPGDADLRLFSEDGVRFH